jgi:hypothetical protein
MALRMEDLVDLTATEMIGLIAEEGVSASDAAVLVGDWVLELGGKAKRTFKYQTDFPESDSACASDFARTFEHQDWIDGESIVQAEQTTVEEGFNVRFHRIEADLDALGADVAKAFLCLAEMRASLRALLDEIRSEINRLNSDVHECCTRDTPPGGGLTFPIDPGTFGVARELMGVTKFLDEDYMVYNIGGRIEMFPVVLPPDEGRVINPLDDDRVKKAADLVAVFEDEEVKAHFENNPLTKKEILEHFGDKEVREGVMVEDLVRVLPAGETFTSPTEMIKAISSREAAVLRISGRGEAIAAHFGVGDDVGLISDAPVERLGLLSPEASKVLAESGFDTIGRLAEADSRTIASALGNVGIDVSVGEVSTWTATAHTLSSIR